MISYLRGRIIHKTSHHLIIDVHDIGYQVFAGENLLNALSVGNEAELFIHHQVREDASDLYGFTDTEELELFEMLLTVSGVGPKSALGVLSIASAGDIKEAIVRGDANLLTKVSGIGKKTAERVVLELKTKVLRSGVPTLSGEHMVSGSDEIDALMALGYSLSEARAALSLVDPAITDSAARVREALKKMAKK